MQKESNDFDTKEQARDDFKTALQAIVDNKTSDHILSSFDISLEMLLKHSLTLQELNVIIGSVDVNILFKKIEDIKNPSTSMTFVNGHMYYQGLGVAQSFPKAIECYEAAAIQGCSAAQCNLADMHYNGFGVNQNYSKAIKYYEAAEKKGNNVAKNNLPVVLFNIGRSYRNGTDVSKDYEKAAKYYKMSADKGFALAQIFFASLLSNNPTNREILSLSNACQWFNKVLDNIEGDKHISQKELRSNLYGYFDNYLRHQPHTNMIDMLTNIEHIITPGEIFSKKNLPKRIKDYFQINENFLRAIALHVPGGDYLCRDAKKIQSERRKNVFNAIDIFSACGIHSDFILKVASYLAINSGLPVKWNNEVIATIDGVQNNLEKPKTNEKRTGFFSESPLKKLILQQKLQLERVESEKEAECNGSRL